MNSPVPLTVRHTKNCRFVHNRYVAMNHLPKKAVIAEVGVLAGDLSAWLLQHVTPKELHLIDVFDCDDYPAQRRFTQKENEQFVSNRFKEEISKGQVVMKKGYSWDMLALYPDHYFDWIYIDAGHDYYSVKKDLSVAGKKVKPNGYLVMNDYIMFDHLAKTEYGVVQATNEFCIENNWELLFFAFHPSLFCDVVIQKIKDK